MEKEFEETLNEEMLGKEVSITDAIQNSMNVIATHDYLQLNMNDWRKVLPEECQVYVFSESYLAKRFDEINYEFCGEEEAKRILTDNLYALLRFKYFPTKNDEIDARITQIVKSFCDNLKTTLIRVSFDNEDVDENGLGCSKVNFIPDGSIAFKNGVFDFVHNEWLFKYDIQDMPELHNRLYMYDRNYIVMWYFNCNFEPMEIDISKLELNKFILMMKEQSKKEKNYCFELMYNMAHNVNDKFSIEKFEHLCEVLGYVCLQSFSQNFVMLIGSGQNGKNSLFDGCFTYWLRPRPAANSLDTIEEDRFITGSLENKSHNLFLESSAKTYTESQMIKALTGSMYQTIESKGIQKYSGLINCKFVFAGNDQDNIKFSDTTVGFKRRINIFEIAYRWDSYKNFLLHGDYYDTTFDDDLNQLTSDRKNLWTLIYFAMYGIKKATSDFTKSFKFSYNDYAIPYSTLDKDMKTIIDNITLDTIVHYIGESQNNYREAKTAFYTVDSRLPLQKAANIGVRIRTFDDVVKIFESPEDSAVFFSNNDIYIQIKFLQNVAGIRGDKFIKDFKQLYQIKQTPSLYANRPYVRCSFNGRKIVIRH